MILARPTESGTDPLASAPPCDAIHGFFSVDAAFEAMPAHHQLAMAATVQALSCLATVAQLSYIPMAPGSSFVHVHRSQHIRPAGPTSCPPKEMTFSSSSESRTATLGNSRGHGGALPVQLSKVKVPAHCWQLQGGRAAATSRSPSQPLGTVGRAPPNVETVTAT